MPTRLFGDVAFTVGRIGASFKVGAGRLEVGRQFITHPPPNFGLRSPQSGRRMVSCQDRLSPFGREHFAAVLRDFENLAR